ncbi:MAG: hypothetical protein DI585_01875 [Pseudomonas fluorescens]|nr:MAG: hypothetical protein DI585_01875 [Pseudomonas fluorescens]
MAKKANGLFYGVATGALRGFVTAGKACSGALVEMMRAPVYGDGPSVALNETPQVDIVADTIERTRDLPTMFGCPRGF